LGPIPMQENVTGRRIGTQISIMCVVLIVRTLKVSQGISASILPAEHAGIMAGVMLLLVVMRGCGGSYVACFGGGWPLAKNLVSLRWGHMLVLALPAPELVAENCVVSTRSGALPAWLANRITSACLRSRASGTEIDDHALPALARGLGSAAHISILILKFWVFNFTRKSILIARTIWSME
jgi:hypothetical protein